MYQLKKNGQEVKKGQEIVILLKTNKEDSSPSLRCVCCPKVEIFVEMFCANYRA